MRFRHRNATIRRLSASGVLFGEWWGREDRSCIPATPRSANRSAHRFAVGQETRNIRAADETLHPSSMIRRASRKRARGVNSALAWDTKASGL